jgi:transcriptional regulator with XRE-family HTH domain
MNTPFAETLRKLRKEKGLSQTQLGIQMFVNRSTIARWENGIRLPDAAMITRLSRVLGVDIGILLSAATKSDESPNVIIVDDNKINISESVFVLEEAMPNATILGFNRRNKAIEYAKTNRVNLAFLDIELGMASGLDLCRELLEINPCTNVVYLTAYPDYSLDAWETGACGFMVKPLTPEGVRRQLNWLRNPFYERDTEI